MTKQSNYSVNEVMEFLTHSNLIENVSSEEALTDAFKAWDYIIAHDKLTVGVILGIHSALMENLNPSIAGRHRQVDVWVGHRACPAPHIAKALLDNWPELHGSANTEETIKQAHIAFEKIHPFEDGNGRTGRIIMNWQRLKAGLPILVIHQGSEQLSYYEWFN